jgi:hypothetical protein
MLTSSDSFLLSVRFVTIRQVLVSRSTMRVLAVGRIDPEAFLVVIWLLAQKTVSCSSDESGMRPCHGHWVVYICVIWRRA